MGLDTDIIKFEEKNFNVKMIIPIYIPIKEEIKFAESKYYGKKLCILQAIQKLFENNYILDEDFTINEEKLIKYYDNEEKSYLKEIELERMRTNKLLEEKRKLKEDEKYLKEIAYNKDVKTILNKEFDNKIEVKTEKKLETNVKIEKKETIEIKKFENSTLLYEEYSPHIPSCLKIDPKKDLNPNFEIYLSVTLLNFLENNNKMETIVILTPKKLDNINLELLPLYFFNKKTTLKIINEKEIKLNNEEFQCLELFNKKMYSIIYYNDFEKIEKMTFTEKLFFFAVYDFKKNTIDLELMKDIVFEKHLQFQEFRNKTVILSDYNEKNITLSFPLNFTNFKVESYISNDYKDYIEYYQKKYNIDVSNCEDTLIECYNFNLTNNDFSMDKISTPKPVYIVPTIVKFTRIPKYFFLYSLAIPYIFWNLEKYLLINDLKKELNIEKIKSQLILEALTGNQAQEKISYERFFFNF
jgi:hypothetical protein